jgi:hypothetical protein
MKIGRGFLILSILPILAGCATSDKEILSQFRFETKQKRQIESDLRACEVSAYNAGYTRVGGLLTEGSRVKFIERCLEKTWKKL